MLEIKRLNKKFKKKIALDGLDISLDCGVYGLLGPNGAGKTTLIRCMTNLYKFKGEILYDDIIIQNNRHYMQNIGYLSQKFGAYRELTVEENLRYFCVLKDLKKANWDKEINRVMQAVNLCNERHKKAKNLSGGMVRRLGVAQVLLGDPEVMIFDEPTAGLDPEERLRFKMIISSLPNDKLVLISTHIVEDVDALCNQIIIMNQGKVDFKGDAKSLKAIAEGKTFECRETELSQITGEYYLEKQFEQDNERRYRFVSASSQDCLSVQPRIEDGYICILEKI